MRQPDHRLIGDALGCEGETETLWLCCSCGFHQIERVSADESIRKALAEATCGGCGRVGMKRGPR